MEQDKDKTENDVTSYFKSSTPSIFDEITSAIPCSEQSSEFSIATSQNSILQNVGDAAKSSDSYSAHMSSRSSSTRHTQVEAPLSCYLNNSEQFQEFLLESDACEEIISDNCKLNESSNGSLTNSVTYKQKDNSSVIVENSPNFEVAAGQIYSENVNEISLNPKINSLQNLQSNENFNFNLQSKIQENLLPNFTSSQTQSTLPHKNILDNLILSSDPNLIPSISSKLYSQSSELDQVYDSWLPKISTRETLESLSSATPGSFKVDKELLVSPSIAIKEDFEDPIVNIQKQLGLTESEKTNRPNVSNVTQDDNGLRMLISAGCYHSAVNLTTQLLTVYGQVERKPGQICKHTPHSLQLWFTRLSLLVKLRRFSAAEAESSSFGDLDSPDLYFEFYPEMYGHRRGSMVPFSFRLLVAELPHYLGKHLQALDKLSFLMSVCNKMISNLRTNSNENGSQEIINSFKENSLKIWNDRKLKVLHALMRCSVSMKDFRLAHSLLEKLIELCESNEEKSRLYGTLGRLYLFMGDCGRAQETFKKQIEQSEFDVKNKEILSLMNSALIACFQNDFKSAVDLYQKVLDINPNEPLAINNLGVSLIFIGEIRDGINLVEKSILDSPSKTIHESIILNLATMYELETASPQLKKNKLFEIISKYKGDGFNMAAIKLQA